MSARDDETSETPIAADETIWPRPIAGLRSLTREELEGLEAALELGLSEGRKWLDQVDSDPIKTLLEPI